jgi:hypothetical protein
MGLREAVESELCLSDAVSVDECKNIIAAMSRALYPDARLYRMARHLLAFLETADPEDAEKDELRMRLRMRCAAAEVDADKAWKKLARLQERCGIFADTLQSHTGGMSEDGVRNTGTRLHDTIEQ